MLDCGRRVLRTGNRGAEAGSQSTNETSDSIERGAAAAARDCAPYMHAKLQATAILPLNDPAQHSRKSDSELQLELDELSARMHLAASVDASMHASVDACVDACVDALDDASIEVRIDANMQSSTATDIDSRVDADASMQHHPRNPNDSPAES